VEREDCTADPPHYNEREIPALGHDEGEWHITLEATCSATGIKELRCTRDEFVLQANVTVDIDPNAHDYGYWITTAPTCTTKGIDTRTCSRNPAHKETRNETAIDPTAHAWEPVSTTATETTNGIEGRVCNNNHDHDEITIVEYATGTDGLEFNLISINDGTDNAYRVHNGGDRTFTAVHIPAFHRLDADSPYLPVTAISNGTNIGTDNAFGGIYVSTDDITPNTNLTTVTFAAESQLTTIGDRAFYYCTSLDGIIIPDSVQTIGQQAFGSCTSLASVTIPASVTSLGVQSAFIFCTSLTTVTFAEGIQLTTISMGTFSYCTSLTSITIPSSVTTILPVAFGYCDSLASVTIPDSVTEISEQAFWNCTSLASITVDANNPNYTSEGGILYNKDKTTLIAYPSASGSVTILASVTSIGNFAFYNCTGLTGITIPDSVTSIGQQAFVGCTSLTSVTFEGTIASGSFSTNNPFPGDLRAKFYAAPNTANGTPGTYTREPPATVWTKQP
jgi:hypothetical protein